MKVTYIGHSGFSVELSGCVLLFDYYQGKLPVFAPEKALFVFVSHKHADHFQHGIFALAGEHPHVRYILSKDTKMSEKYRQRIGIPEEAEGNIFYIGKNERMTCQAANAEVSVRTLESTDEGVAFVVEAEGKRIYHAGDLNWWTWPGEESEAEYRDMTRRFFDEMKKLENEALDLAFVPLDPRQGERYDWGLDAFMRTVRAAVVFPMHFWEDYGVFDRFFSDPKTEPYRDRVRRIRRPGEVFELVL
ncbi:MAG: MBL fold metallo-hydrolase [Lachnospiraceae bacterium]|nr:MBL fold metallo-hydrolase [Lachnospiraceae bacterium]